MVVGWHAMTLPQNSKELAASRWDMLATLLAVGLDPKRSVIFHQEDVRKLYFPAYTPLITRYRTKTMLSLHGYLTALRPLENYYG